MPTVPEGFVLFEEEAQVESSPKVPEGFELFEGSAVEVSSVEAQPKEAGFTVLVYLAQGHPGCMSVSISMALRPFRWQHF